MIEEFLAVDVETANRSRGSICQIGVARFVKGEMTGGWSSLVNPEQDFDSQNVRIHGIRPQAVASAKTIPSIYPILNRLLSLKTCVSHTNFDPEALAMACERYGLAPPRCTWIDSREVVRESVGNQFPGGYGLANLCSAIGHNFKHHDALADAESCGRLLIAAYRGEIASPGGGSHERNNFYAPSIKRTGSPDGALRGKCVVFTGEISISRTEAADLAHVAGMAVKTTISKKVDFVVVGDQDLSLLKGHQKSTKHRKAEALASTGHHIRIISEGEFRAIIDSAD